MKKYLLLLLALNSMTLNSCSTMSIDVGDVSEAELAHERRTRATILKDRTIEAVAYAELKDAQDLLTETHVTVSAYNGAVLVTGEAANAKLGQKIITLVQDIDNIRLIHNNLVIAPPSDTTSRAEDRRIADTVRTALMQIRSIPNFDPAMVKVVVENANVYLMGAVHRNEGTVVVNVTRLQSGIKQIITVFQYLD